MITTEYLLKYDLIVHLEMKVSLVTGGAGFIGSHLCESLLMLGHRVIAIDNLITGSINNINHLNKDQNFAFINRDVSKHFDIIGDLDHVFHFASPASPPDYERGPAKFST